MRIHGIYYKMPRYQKHCSTGPALKHHRAPQHLANTTTGHDSPQHLPSGQTRRPRNTHALHRCPSDNRTTQPAYTARVAEHSSHGPRNVPSCAPRPPRALGAMHAACRPWTLRDRETSWSWWSAPRVLPHHRVVQLPVQPPPGSVLGLRRWGTRGRHVADRRGWGTRSRHVANRRT